MALAKDLKSVKVNFNLRQLKDVNQLTGVNCIVRWNNQRLVLTNIDRIRPKEWNEKDQKAMNKFTGHSEFNHRLKTVKTDIENVYRQFLNDNKKYPTVDEFRVIAKKALNRELSETEPAHSKDIVKFIDQFIKDCEQGVKTAKGRPMSPNSVKRYKALNNNLVEFVTAKKLRGLTFDKLTVGLIQDFKRFLITDKEYTPGTVNTRLTGLTTILNWATKLGVNKNLVFKDAGLNERVPQTFEIYLNLNELQKIQDIDLTGKPRLDKVRDLFLLGCWTSLRFSDLFQIDHTLIEQDPEGNKNIRITPKKTSKELIIPVLPVVQEILDKYLLPDGSIELPMISNQKFNQYIKDLGEEAGLKEEITFELVKAGKREIVKVRKYELIKSHTMRRSFATNLYEMGEDIKAIMDATGHARTDIFFNYIRRTKNNSANKLRQTVETAMRKRMKAVS